MPGAIREAIIRVGVYFCTDCSRAFRTAPVKSTVVLSGILIVKPANIDVADER